MAIEGTAGRGEGGTTYGYTTTVSRRLVHVCAAQLACRRTTVDRVACLINPNVVLDNDK